MVRKSICARQTNKAPPKRISQNHLPPVEVTQRTWIRHYEAALAACLWAVALPVLLFGPARYMAPVAVVLIIVIACLVMHSFALRPFCMEIFPEEEQTVKADEIIAHEWSQDTPTRTVVRTSSMSDPENNTDITPVPASVKATSVFQEELSPIHPTLYDRYVNVSKVSQNERKVMMVGGTLFSAVGSVIAVAIGGSEAAHTWMAAGKSGCSVMDLGAIHQDGYFKFFCDDGYVDAGTEVSLMKSETITIFNHQMRTFRMAPVYKSSMDKKEQGLPVAWAVSRSGQLVTKCDNGLCGVLVATDDPATTFQSCTSVFCVSPEEETYFSELKRILRDKIGQQGGVYKFDFDTMPLVDLTDPRNPDGRAKQMFFAIVLYACSLLGFVAFFIELVSEELTKRNADRNKVDRSSTAFPADSGYAPIGSGGSPRISLA